MAQAVEAPAGTMAEGPTSHTQNQAEALLNGLDPDQIMMLREELEEWRVGDDGKGHAAIDHWDVRRTLIRVFGVGGFDIFQVHPPEMVAVQEIPASGNGSAKYTVTYRALSRLVLRNRRGVQLAVFEDGAIDEGLKQPSLTQAHDQGYKGAMSGALKRCAINLGDVFGLSLYNKGSLVPVVYTPADRYRDQAVEAWDDFTVIGQTYASAKQDNVLDRKVWNYDRTARVALWRLLQDRGGELQPDKPKQDDHREQPKSGSPAEGEGREDARRQEQAGGTTLEALKDKINAGWSNRISCQQNLEDARIHGLLDETVKVGEMEVRIEDLLTQRIAKLKAQVQAAQGGATEGQAA